MCVLNKLFDRWYSDSLIQIGCAMNFSHYPFDVHECTFLLGSIGSTADTIIYVAEFKYEQETQRHTPFQVYHRKKLQNNKCLVKLEYD